MLQKAKDKKPNHTSNKVIYYISLKGDVGVHLSYEEALLATGTDSPKDVTQVVTSPTYLKSAIKRVLYKLIATRLDLDITKFKSLLDGDALWTLFDYSCVTIYADKYYTTDSSQFGLYFMNYKSCFSYISPKLSATYNIDTYVRYLIERFCDRSKAKFSLITTFPIELSTNYQCERYTLHKPFVTQNDEGFYIKALHLHLAKGKDLIGTFPIKL